MNRERSLTKYDLLFFFEFCGALIANSFILRWNTATILMLILIGLTFELLTSASWTYSGAFKRSFFVVGKSDISVAAAFSWAGVLMLLCAVSCIVQRYLPMSGGLCIVTLLVVGIGGNVLETICYRWGMFTYNNTPVTRMFIFRQPMVISGVPLAVRLGYFCIFGPLGWAFLRVAGPG